MTTTVQIVPVQINSGGAACPPGFPGFSGIIPMPVVNDGTSNTFGSTPFVDAVPVSLAASHYLPTVDVAANAALGIIAGLLAGPLATQSPRTTYQGTIIVPANASTAINASDVSMAPASAACPTVFNKITIINTGANVGYVNWLGGAAGAANGSEPIQPGASDTVNLAGSTSPPTLFSPAGTTFAFRN